MNIYHFRVYFNILEETGITISGLTVRPIHFSQIMIETNKNLTENQIETIKTKIKQFFNNKFNLTSVTVELVEVIK